MFISLYSTEIYFWPDLILYCGGVIGVQIIFEISLTIFQLFLLFVYRAVFHESVVSLEKNEEKMDEQY